MTATEDRPSDLGEATKPLPELMAELNRRRDTGTLAVVGARGRRELLFVNGELRAARSEIEAERLASWLVARHFITEEDKQFNLLKQGGHEPSPLGHILVRRGLVEQAQLENELEELALTIIARAAADTDASLSFQPGATIGQPDTLPNTATAQLVLHAARAYPDEEAKHAALGGPANLVRLIHSLDDLVQEYEFELPEAILLGRLHRGQRLGDLVNLVDLPPGVFDAGLYALMAAGIVELVDEPPRSQPPPVAQGRPRPETQRPGPPPAAAAMRPAAPTSPAGGPSAPAGDTHASREEVNRLAGSLSSLDHYQLLGLTPDASYQDIFDAWDRFSSHFDPIRGGKDRLADARPQLEAILQRGREAFETLSSPQKRPRYDRMVRADQPAHRSKMVRDMATQRTVPSERGAADAARLEVAQANIARAEELARAGDVFTAISLLEQACALDPQPDGLLKLARLMLLNPHWSNRALEKLRLALELDPMMVDAWMELAEFWRRRKHAERERKALERVLQTAPDHPEAIARYRELMGDSELRRLLARLSRRSD